MDGGSAGFAGAVHRSIQLIYLGLRHLFGNKKPLASLLLLQQVGKGHKLVQLQCTIYYGY
jgi:hypothetical protein